MKALIPIILALLGMAGGGALGVMFMPEPVSDEAPVEEAKSDEEIDNTPRQPDPKDGARSFVDVGKQIIIPVVEQGETKALMLFELAVDVPEGEAGAVVAMEPRLRDAFLRELFEMSYTRAFHGTYTDERVTEELRAKLRRAARRLLGDMVADVLVLDVIRQEL